MNPWMICWYYNIHIFLGSNILCANYINIPPVLRIFGSLVKSRSIYGGHRFRQEADVVVTNPGIIDLRRRAFKASDGALRCEFPSQVFFWSLFFHGGGKNGKTHWSLRLVAPPFSGIMNFNKVDSFQEKVSWALGGQPKGGRGPPKDVPNTYSKTGKTGRTH